MAALGLGCRPQAFVSCGERRWASHAAASLITAHRPQGVQASGGVVLRLSCPVACGIFPDQRLNPCPLHWQADS